MPPTALRITTWSRTCLAGSRRSPPARPSTNYGLENGERSGRWPTSTSSNASLWPHPRVRTKMPCSPIRSAEHCWWSSIGCRRHNVSPSCCTTCSRCLSRRSARRQGGRRGNPTVRVARTGRSRSARRRRPRYCHRAGGARGSAAADRHSRRPHTYHRHRGRW
jgi:hypothetical protein